jgi:hypothetical protein
VDVVSATVLQLHARERNAMRFRTFLWAIQGLGDSSRAELTITVTPTPFGLTQGVAVTDVRLGLLPTSKDRAPQTMGPTRTEPASMAGLRAWFTKPGSRFHLLVTFADGSTQTIDIYRQAPPDPKPRTVGPKRLVAPVGRWGTIGPPTPSRKKPVRERATVA